MSYVGQPTDSLDVILKQLNPGTKYSVRINAINVIGEGGSTEVTEVTKSRGKHLYNSVQTW